VVSNDLNFDFLISRFSVLSLAGKASVVRVAGGVCQIVNMSRLHSYDFIMTLI